MGTWVEADRWVPNAIPCARICTGCIGFEDSDCHDDVLQVSGVESGVVGLESSIQDLKTLVKSMGTPPRKQETRESAPMAGSSSPSMAGPERLRTAPSPEVETLRRERESRQARLQKLYQELTRLEPS